MDLRSDKFVVMVFQQNHSLGNNFLKIKFELIQRFSFTEFHIPDSPESVSHKIKVLCVRLSSNCFTSVFRTLTVL